MGRPDKIFFRPTRPGSMKVGPGGARYDKTVREALFCRNCTTAGPTYVGRPDHFFLVIVLPQLQICLAYLRGQARQVFY